MTALPVVSPTEAQVDARGVLGLLDAWEADPDIAMHSMMLLRHGRVFAQGWWAPYSPERVHLLYSVSKSFTSTALGLAVGEGLVGLDDPVLEHLADLAPDVVDDHTAAMRVRHLASMSTGHLDDTWSRVVEADPHDPVRAFLRLPPERPPGSVFAYNQSATYALGGPGPASPSWPRSGWPRRPGHMSPPLCASSPTGRRATPSGSGSLCTAIAGTARSGSSAWCCPSSTWSWPPPPAPRRCSPCSTPYGATSLPAVGTPSTPDADAELARRLAGLTLPVESGSTTPDPPDTQPSRRFEPAGGRCTAQPSLVRVEVGPEAGDWRLTLVERVPGSGERPLTVRVAGAGWTVSPDDGDGPTAVTGGRTGSGDLRFCVLFLETPHELVLVCRPADGTFEASWSTMPLGGGLLHRMRAPLAAQGLS